MSNPQALPTFVLRDDEPTEANMRWQLQCGRPHEYLGHIEYAPDYVNFCIDEDSRSFDLTDLSGRRVATTCGHVVHPSCSDECQYCPVCIVVTYLKALWLVTDAWDQTGGPWHKATNVQRYKRLRRALTRFRLEMEQLITSLEDQADNEALWEVQQTSCILREGVQTATNAVQIARTLARYPVVGMLERPSKNKAPSSG